MIIDNKTLKLSKVNNNENEINKLDSVQNNYDKMIKIN